MTHLKLKKSGLFYGAGRYFAPAGSAAGGASQPAAEEPVSVYGTDNSDVFDSVKDVDQTLYGKKGDDTYWLGAGTGDDVINEYFFNSGDGDAGDKVKLKSGYTAADVRLRRSNDGNHLYVELMKLLNGEKVVTDSLKVEYHYLINSAKIESVELADGTVLWNASGLAAAEIIGGESDDTLTGKAGMSDVFDGYAGGNDTLRGYGGDDVYKLGEDTDHDVIREYEGNSGSGDAADKIVIKSGSAAAKVRLRRSDDGNHLHVELLKEGKVTDSLKVEFYYLVDSARVERVEFADDSETVWTVTDFAAAEIMGSDGDDNLYGIAGFNDVFDSDAGGDDTLYGYSGNDVYKLGKGTGDDVIREYEGNSGSGDANDGIKVKSGFTSADVRLLRSGDDLIVQLLDKDGKASDSLTVEKHFSDDKSAKIEFVEFADRTEWEASDLSVSPISGTTGNDKLYGKKNLSDEFDANAGGDDELYGKSGNDVYWLGAGTDRDVIKEYDDNSTSGDLGDMIRIKSGFTAADVRLRRSDDGDHLFVDLLDARDNVSDSLKVENHYTDDAAKIEIVELADGTLLWDADGLAAAKIIGTRRNDKLYGKDNTSDVFDGNAGGDDKLYGYGGNDVYWLGAKTDHDTILEYRRNSGDLDDRIKIDSSYTTADVRLRRSDDGDDLIVELLDDDDEVTDSLTVEDHFADESAKVESVEFTDAAATVWTASDLAKARITGGEEDDELDGKANMSDVFDGNAGDDDELYGYSGNDVYWLGAGTDHDTIVEYHRNSGDEDDRIKIKSGYTLANTRLRRSDDGDDLLVELLDAKGKVTDSLTVEDYFADESAKIERVEFTDITTVWTAADFALARITGGSRGDDLEGRDDMSDVFDSNAGGSDDLYGYGGNDVYWLGAKTGQDTILEYHRNSGDDDDRIKIKDKYGVVNVRLLRSDDGDDLYVDLLEADGTLTSSLTVEDYYADDSAKVESVEFADGTVWKLADMAATEALGSSGADTLSGRQGVNDILQGGSGNDTYSFGAGSGHDVIKEHVGGNSGDTGDKISLKAGVTAANVRLLRSRDEADLIVQLLDADGEVTDSLTVDKFYTDASAKVESVAFADGTVWNATDLALTKIKGTAGDDTLSGKADKTDVFDADTGGNDTLRGGSGNDVYWLGTGTGADVIKEGDSSAGIARTDSGDAGDMIRIKSAHGVGDVLLRRSGSDLLVQLIGAAGAVTDSLKVEGYYTNDAAKAEFVEFEDGTVWNLADRAASEVLGTSGADDLAGRQNVNDILQGGSGNDTYSLGAGSGHDVIREHAGNSGDSGDKISLKSGVTAANARLLRSRDEADLIVQLLDADGAVTDSLTVDDYYTDAAAKVETVEFADKTVWNATDLALTPIKGTTGDDTLSGKADKTDVFDADTGGNDTLRGGSGNDVYWLGTGTGRDVIKEGDSSAGIARTDSGDAGDMIRIKSGHGVGDVRLRRSGSDLLVQLIGAAGVVTDSLKVEGYYTNDAAKVEFVEFADGTVWNVQDVTPSADAITGTAGNDTLDGSANKADEFNSSAGGNDILRGGSGNDTYWLGEGTGRDVIREYYGNAGAGVADDKIRIKTGYTPADVRLIRSGYYGINLVVQLLDGKGNVTDSLMVENHFDIEPDNSLSKNAKVESIEAAGHVLRESRYQDLIDELAAFTAKTSLFDSLDAIYSRYWAGEEIEGTAGNDSLEGKQNTNSILYGFGGDDVYLLGAGTGHDTVVEHHENSGDLNDKIRIKSGYTTENARLRRSNQGRDLLVELLDDDKNVTDSLTVEDYYADDSAKIESVEFTDSDTVWTAKDFALAPITGGLRNDGLPGLRRFNDVFDTSAGGNDIAAGRGGDDVYWLGAGTGHDVIREGHWGGGEFWTSGGNDTIKVKSGYALTDIHLRRSGNNLYVELLGDDGKVTDSLKVEHQYTWTTSKLENIEAAGHVLRENQFQGLISELAAFTAGTSTYDSLAAIHDHYWEEDTTLSSSSG